MKYLNIELKDGAVLSCKDLMDSVDYEFPRHLNFTEAFGVLEEQCRPLGLQPEIYLDAVRIVPASKKFMNRERRYNAQLSKRAREYIRFRETK